MKSRNRLPWRRSKRSLQIRTCEHWDHSGSPRVGRRGFPRRGDFLKGFGVLGVTATAEAVHQLRSCSRSVRGKSGMLTMAVERPCTESPSPS